VRHPRSTPLVRFLRNPPHALAHALTVFAHALAHLLPLALGVVVAGIAVLVARAVLSRVQDARRARGARLLELAVPPQLDL
jgi:hypothetical protein